MREAIQYKELQNDDSLWSFSPYGTNFGTTYQYSFVGPLSLSKGCDLAMPLSRTNLDSSQDISSIPDYAYRGCHQMFTMTSYQLINLGGNPAVVTDATCYMDWIGKVHSIPICS